LSGHAYLGFDSYGIVKYSSSGDWVDILDGFFVSTREKPDGSGPNVPEIVATSYLFAQASVNLYVVRGLARLEIQLVGQVDIGDPNDDGKLRVSECAMLFNHCGAGSAILSIFRLSMTATAVAELQISVGVGIFTKSWSKRFGGSPLFTLSTPLCRVQPPWLDVDQFLVDSVLRLRHSANKVPFVQCISLSGVGSNETISCKEARDNPNAVVKKGKDATPLNMPSTREYTAVNAKEMRVGSTNAPKLPPRTMRRKRDTVATLACPADAEQIQTLALIALLTPIEVRCGVQSLLLDYGGVPNDQRGNGVVVTLLPEAVRVLRYGAISISNYTIDSLTVNGTSAADTFYICGVANAANITLLGGLGADKYIFCPALVIIAVIRFRRERPFV
jgi:hypothetical protein